MTFDRKSFTERSRGVNGGQNPQKSGDEFTLLHFHFPVGSLGCVCRLSAGTDLTDGPMYPTSLYGAEEKTKARVLSPEPGLP